MNLWAHPFYTIVYFAKLQAATLWSSFMICMSFLWCNIVHLVVIYIFIISMLPIWKWFYKYLLYFRQVQSTEFDFDDDDIGTTPKVTPQRLPGMLYFCTVYGIHNQIQIIFMWISYTWPFYFQTIVKIYIYIVSLFDTKP